MLTKIKLVTRPNHGVASPLRPGFAKAASLGGDGNDIPFEQSFSNLAHSHLTNKAPTLLDHELGFQLIDRSEDNSKALGALAFKVGSDYIYAPVFFLKGAIKCPSLWDKGQDLFFPLKENWIQYRLNRKPHILGAGVPRDLRRQGVRQPDLNRLSQAPFKFASHIPETFQPFLCKYAQLMQPDAFKQTVVELEELYAPGRLGMDRFLKTASLSALDTMVGFLRQYPAIASAFDKFHGMDKLADAVKSAAVRERTQSVVADAVIKRAVNRNQLVTGSVVTLLEDEAVRRQKAAAAGVRNKVKVIYYDATLATAPEGLTEEDQEKLLKDTVLIKDERDPQETSIPYNVAVEKKVFNPSESGLYYVLTKPGEFEKCFVSVFPHGPNGRGTFATVVRLDGKDWCNAPVTSVFCGARIDGDEYTDWFEGLPKPDGLSGDYDKHYILIGPRGDSTAPFRVEQSLGDKAGKVYDVHFRMSCHQRGVIETMPRFGSRLSQYDDYDTYRDGERLHLDEASGTKMRSARGDVYVPGEYRLLRASGDDETLPTKEGESYKPPLRLGNIADAQMMIMSKTAELKVIADRSEVTINNGRPRSKVAALVHLVRDHGLAEPEARHILKQAETFNGFRCRVKYASPYLTDGSTGTSPTFMEPEYNGANPMGWPGPTAQSFTAEIPVDGMSSANTDTDVYRPKPGGPSIDELRAVQTAAASGQREAFDMSLFNAMKRVTHDETYLEGWKPDLMRGMDKKGRTLFMYYAHGDKFADRYGKRDMPELEDMLTSGFELDGDLILFLTNKTIDPYPEESLRDLDIGDAPK